MPEELQTRDLGGDADNVLGEGGLKPAYEQSWAVVIGINHYRRRPLKFAVRDAAAMAHALIERYGFSPGNIFLVLDDIPNAEAHALTKWLAEIGPRLGCLEKNATRNVIEKLVLTTLPRKTRADDRVLVYFSGHGAARLTPGETFEDAMPYLVAADSVPDEWDTYIDLTNLLRGERYLQAKHVFYVLDACCSGLTGLRAEAAPTRFERGLLQRRARQCLCAGTAEEEVADQGRDGHSIFTWHLLKALESTSDGSDYMLSASSLIDRVKGAVGNEADYKQTPNGFPIVGDKGGQFVFSAPQAALTLDERVRLARLLIDEVDRRIDEPSAVELGLALWQTILTEAETGALSIEARWRQGQALLMLGKQADAEIVLGDPRLREDPDAMLLRGVGFLQAGVIASAKQELAALADRYGSHAYAGWARLLVEAVEQQPAGRRYALLVGVQRHAKYPNLRLAGCHNDVHALAEVLQKRLEFDQPKLLFDAEATTAGILAELEKFAALVRPNDAFFFYFSGNGFLVPRKDAARTAVFGSYDVDIDGGLRGTLLDETTIERAMAKIPAGDKLVITDACHLAPLKALPGCRFLSGGLRDQFTMEITRENSPRGAFTYALERAIAGLGNAPIPTLLTRIDSDLNNWGLSGKQTPHYFGPPSNLVADRTHPALQAIDLAVRRAPGRFSASDLKVFADWSGEHASIAMTPFRIALGRALLDKQLHRQAAAALKDIEHPEALLPLIQAQLWLARPADALANWKAFTARDAGGKTEVELHGTLERLQTHWSRALLVATRTGEIGGWWADWEADLEPLLLRVREVLVARCGFRPDDVVVLLDAHKDAILAALGQLANRPGEGPTFFLFVGPGAPGADVWLATADARESRRADLSLSALGGFAAPEASLTAAILMTRHFQPQTVEGDRVAATDGPSSGASRDPWKVKLLDFGRWEEITHEQPAPGPTTSSTRDLAVFVPPDFPKLVEILERDASLSFTADHWMRCADAPEGMSIRGDAAVLLFAPIDLRRAVTLAEEIDRVPLHQAIELLSKLTKRRELAAAAWLNLGIVRAALGRNDEALIDIDKAIECRRADGAVRGEDVEEQPGILRWPEAHYHRGRILIEAGRYSEAEAALAVAVRQDESNARAHYHRARAIRRLIARDLRRQAEESSRCYLSLGAPLGLDEDLEPFIAPLGRLGISDAQTLRR